MVLDLMHVDNFHVNRVKLLLVLELIKVIRCILIRERRHILVFVEGLKHMSKYIGKFVNSKRKPNKTWVDKGSKLYD